MMGDLLEPFVIRNESFLTKDDEHIQTYIEEND